MRIGPLLEFSFARTPRAERLNQLALTALLVSALVGLYLGHHIRGAWLIVFLCLLTPFYRLEKVSPWVVPTAQYIAFVLLVGTMVFAYVLMAYPILSEQRIHLFSGVSAAALSGFAFGFLLGARIWRPGVTLIPCALGVFIIAAFNGAARLEPALVMAGLSSVAYLGLESPSRLASQPLTPLAPRIKWRVALLLPPIFLIAAGINWTLPRVQGRVELATADLMNTSTTHYSSFSAESRLGDLAQLQLSPKVVMRVWSTHPQKLRGRIFTHFDGRAWKAPATSVRQLPAAPGLPALDRATSDWLENIPGTSYVPPNPESDSASEGGAIRTKIVQTSFNPGLLVSPARQVIVRADTSSISTDLHQTLTMPLSTSVEIYAILNRRSGDLVQPGAAPPELLAETRRLPERLDPRLVQLARRLAGEATSPEERIHHTVQFLQNECHYSLEVGKFRSEDPVAEFVFDKKRGYCEYFASATAVLLRWQDIPCRYVTGFVVQEWNRRGGHFTVREADAHAWVEAYVPDRGWVEVDPTPQAEFEAVRASLQPSWFDNLREWVQSGLTELAIRIRGGNWRAMLVWLWTQLKAVLLSLGALGIVLLLGVVIVICLGIARSWLKRKLNVKVPTARRTDLGAGASELVELLSRLDDVWARKGFARPASRAPLEHLSAIPPEKLSSDLHAASRNAVDSFYQVSFGGAPTSPKELKELRQALERAAAS